MNPAEEAKDFFDQFTLYLGTDEEGIEYYVNELEAKRCALIAVNLILTFINSLTNEDLNRIRNSKSDAEARRLLREKKAEQLPQDAVMQSVFKIMSGNSELERFKSREKAVEICEYYKGMGFTNARVEETVA
jgi:hypothetical protein